MSRDMTKPTKWVCAQRRLRSACIRPGWSESSLSAWRKLRFLGTLKRIRILWSDWADSQADLSLRWAHTHFVGFVMSRLICLKPFCLILKHFILLNEKFQVPAQNKVWAYCFSKNPCLWSFGNVLRFEHDVFNPLMCQHSVFRLRSNCLSVSMSMSAVLRLPDCHIKHCLFYSWFNVKSEEQALKDFTHSTC